MLQTFIFIVLVITLFVRPVLGIALAVLGVLGWIIWAIFSIFWPVILALMVAGFWFAYKIERKFRQKDYIDIERK